MALLIAGFLITVIISIISLFDKWKSKGNNRKNNKTAVLLCLTGITGASIVLWSGIDSIILKNKADRLASSKEAQVHKQQDMLMQLQKANLILGQQNLEYAKRLDSSSSINNRMSKRLISKAEALDDYNRGVGSFCYVDVARIGKNEHELFLNAEGKNPIRDINMRIVDLNALKTSGDPFSSAIEKQIAVIYPGFSQDLGVTVNLMKDTGVNLNIFYSANGISYIQGFRMRYYHDKWQTANIVYSYKNKTPLLKSIDADFPNQNIFK